MQILNSKSKKEISKRSIEIKNLTKKNRKLAAKLGSRLKIDSGDSNDEPAWFNSDEVKNILEQSR